MSTKSRSLNYQIVIEQPRTDKVGDIVVDRFTTYIYNVRSREYAKKVLKGMLPELRKQGLRMNQQDFQRSFDNLLITRI